MFIDPEAPGSHKRTIYTAMVAPRPIGWISTLAPDGSANLAPFSYFNLVSSAPPIVMFVGNQPADRLEKDTIANARASGEFVYNLSTVPLAAQMVATSTGTARGVDEFVLARLEKAACLRVRPPRVAASPLAFECTVERIVDIEGRTAKEGRSSVVFGRVVGLHVDDRLIGPTGSFDTLAAQPLCRLGGAQYAAIGEVFEILSPYKPHA
jgi:flavin reductase (DIM6/NTAB) family NADH-FMN oxidoreductase RutF